MACLLVGGAGGDKEKQLLHARLKLPQRVSFRDH